MSLGMPKPMEFCQVATKNTLLLVFYAEKAWELVVWLNNKKIRKVLSQTETLMLLPKTTPARRKESFPNFNYNNCESWQ